MNYDLIILVISLYLLPVFAALLNKYRCNFGLHDWRVCKRKVNSPDLIYCNMCGEEK